MCVNVHAMFGNFPIHVFDDDLQCEWNFVKSSPSTSLPALGLTSTQFLKAMWFSLCFVLGLEYDLLSSGADMAERVFLMFVGPHMDSLIGVDRLMLVWRTHTHTHTLAVVTQ